MSTRVQTSRACIFLGVLEYGPGLLKKLRWNIDFSGKFWVLSLFFLRDGSFLSFILEYHGTILYFCKCTVQITAARASPHPGFFPGVLFGSELRARARAHGMEPESTLPSFRDVCDFSII